VLAAPCFCFFPESSLPECISCDISFFGSFVYRVCADDANAFCAIANKESIWRSFELFVYNNLQCNFLRRVAYSCL